MYWFLVIGFQHGELLIHFVGEVQKKKKKSVAVFLSMLLECLNEMKIVLNVFLNFSCGAIIQRAKHTIYLEKYGENKGTIRSSVPQHCLLFPYTNTLSAL